MLTGRVKRRATPLEMAAARVCREAGAIVRTNVLLRDMNISVPANDERRIEVLVQGLPVRQGGQLAVDVTLRSSVKADNTAHAQAADENAAVCIAARRDKERKYPELSAGRCSLVVLAFEIGGRWSDESAQFVRDLSLAKAREAVPVMRASAARMWQRRWMRLLSLSAATAWVESLLNRQDETLSTPDGHCPQLSDIVGRD